MHTIVYYAADDSLGASSEADCDRYRDWAESALRAAYPNHRIVVSAQPATQTAWTDDIVHEDAILDFCARLWDECPWDWDTDNA